MKQAVRQIKQKTRIVKEEKKPHVQKGSKLMTTVLPIIIMVGTFISFSPMLNNEFTNWDDEKYVLDNPMVRDFDWSSIFSKAVVANYHPVTMISLAINYAIGGTDPSGYLLVNLLLHLVNILLVFRFISLLTNNNLFISGFTAIIFAIHPMHVESVAWVSERKDVLYTLFFLASLIHYWKFLIHSKRANLIWCFCFFALSVLSKPAAVVLPLVLVLMDMLAGRKMEMKLFISKWPFFLASIAMGITTVLVQSESAIAGFDLYPVWVRPLFGAYSLITYSWRFFIPYPLSCFHPYPPNTNDMGWIYYAAPLIVVAAFYLIWKRRSHKMFVFGIAFFIINLLLVLQVLSIGTTIVSERYTYVPYVGLALSLAIVLNDLVKSRSLLYLLLPLVFVPFSISTFKRADVWQNSYTLWTDAIDKYPVAAQPRTSRANYMIRRGMDPQYLTYKDSLFAFALEDCNIAQKSNPNHIPTYENRQFLYFQLGRNDEAIKDATRLMELAPENNFAYAIRGASLARAGKGDSAIKDISKALQLNQNNSFALEQRGLLMFNHFKNYKAALSDFNLLIEISPEPYANYYLSRSYCYYMLGNIESARKDALIAASKGLQIPADYSKNLGL